MNGHAEIASYARPDSGSWLVAAVVLEPFSEGAAMEDGFSCSPMLAGLVAVCPDIFACPPDKL